MTEHKCPSADAESDDPTRCKSLSWAKHGGGPLLRCELELNHTGHHRHGGGEQREWSEADAEDTFEPDRGEDGRCRALVEPLGGPTVRCQDVVGHLGLHGNYGHTWTDKAQVRRDAAGAACKTINALLGEVEDAKAECGRLRAALHLLLDAVSDLDDEARAAFPESAVVAAITAMHKE